MPLIPDRGPRREQPGRRLGDRAGGKRVLLWALALFTAASAACGVANSLPVLVAFRAVQGAGTGVLVPVGMTMLYRTFPQAERIRATRMLMLPTLAAPALGPVLGGVIVDSLSLPAGDVRAQCRPRRRPVIGAEIVAGLALLAVFTRAELRAAKPMLQLRILANRLYRPASLQCAAGSAGFMGTLFLVPLFLQNGLGYSALHSGLSTFPEALGGMVGIAISARLYRRTGPRHSRRYRLAFLAAAVAMLAGALIASRVRDADAIATMSAAAEPDSAVAGAEAVG